MPRNNVSLDSVYTQEIGVYFVGDREYLMKLNLSFGSYILNLHFLQLSNSSVQISGKNCIFKMNKSKKVLS